MGDRDAAIKRELGRILASDAFVASPMLSAFLRFVVEETLAGRDDRLKAYAIAVGALGRDTDFDANENPLVRVQARRLRQALQRHYETRSDGAIRIDLPLGTYVPVFLPRAASDPTAAAGRSDDEGASAPFLGASAPGAVSPSRGRLSASRVALILAPALAAGVVIGTWVVDRPPTDPTAPQARTDTATAPRPLAETIGLDASRVLPLLAVAVEVRNAALVGFDGEIFRNHVETFAQRFDDTIVVTRRSPDFPAPAGQPLYRLHFLVSREGSSTNLYFRLLHAGDERVLRSGALSLREAPKSHDGTVVETPAELALVRDFVQLHGAITQDLANLSDLSPELSCLSRAWHYDPDTTARNHLVAETCLEAAVARNPRLAPALTLLGAMYLGEYRQGSSPASGEPLARAEDMLRRATVIAPASSAPYQTLRNLLLIKGDVTAALLAGRRSVELNPEDMNAVGGYGSLLARVGRYADALPLLNRASLNMGSPPKWLQYYTLLALNNLGRTEEADRQVAFFEGTRSSLYLTAVAVRAHRRGDETAAAAALSTVATIETDFGSDPRAFLRRRGFADRVIDRLMADLPSLAVAPR